jgi:plasmid stabilization system protein ParE
VTYQLFFEQDAKTDIASVADWYRDLVDGLESEFLSSLKTSLDKLEANPYQYQVRFRDIRTVLLHKFPYQIFYKIFEDKIIILGVVHTSRNPRLIRRRIKK